MSELDLPQSESSTNKLLAEVQNSNESTNINSQDIDLEAIPQVVIDDSSEEIFTKKGKKRKAALWEYFVETTFPIKGVPTSFWQCLCCQTKFQKSKTGTTTKLLRHVRKCGQIKAKRKQAVDLSEKRQKLLNFMPLDVDADVEIPVFHNPKSYDQYKIREVISKMIIVHEYPFNIVDHTWFNILLKAINPNYKNVSRNTIKNDCMKIYEFEKEKLKKEFADVHMFSLTSDSWTSSQTIKYMCLTAHYIDQSWKIQKRIINFIELDPSHTGTFICDVICDCLLDWKIQDKVSTITLDNAGNNDVAVSLLKSNFMIRDKLHFKGHFFHVRCCARILNIMVQVGLKEIHDISHNIRESVKYLKKSPTRLHKFVEISRQLGISTSKGLCIDVPTRWNSTYLMIESALIFRKVFTNYADWDNNFSWLLSDLDWEKYDKIRKFFVVFNNVTKVISDPSYPTSNIFLPAILDIRKLLLDESTSSDEYNRNMAIAMRSKFDKYWDECNLLMYVAAVLDPRLKMKFIHFIFAKIYTSVEINSKIQQVEDVLWEIYNNYSSDIASSSSASHNVSLKLPSDLINPEKFDFMLGFTDFVISSSLIQPLKSDLQVYLEEGLFLANNEQFDVLEWWKFNTLKYPCLSKMAKDILLIPITTVTSESAFNTGGRLLNDYRSSLSTKTVNALICSSSWIRSSTSSLKTPLQELLEEEHLELTLPE